MELDNAVTMQLLEYDAKKDAENREFWVNLLGGNPEESRGDVF